MAPENLRQEQDQNTAKLVLNAFYKVADNDGASAVQITEYLRDTFGDVWNASTLTWKAEETLKRSAILGFLDRQGDRYIVNVTREVGCRRRRRSFCPKCRQRCCYKRFVRRNLRFNSPHTEVR